MELQQKSKILSSVLKQNVGETVHTSMELIFEGKVVNSLMEYLVKLKSEKKFVLLYEMIANSPGDSDVFPPPPLP